METIDFVIASFLDDLDEEIDLTRGVINIKEKIRGVEQQAAETPIKHVTETPEDRIAEFRSKLHAALEKRLTEKPTNKVWYDAVLVRLK